MADDARLSTQLPAHPKTKKLIRRLGQASAWNLVCLILWAAGNRSDGDLSGMSTEDIELSADWLGEEGVFVRALTEVRFLDGEEGAYRLHDWQEHNPWAAGAEMRSAKARWNAAKQIATPAWLTTAHLQKIAALYEESRRLTATTGVEHHVDHIVPLRGRTVCGLHAPWNLRVVTADFNRRKSNTVEES